MRREDRKERCTEHAVRGDLWGTAFTEGGRHESMLGNPSGGMKFPKEEVKKTGAICTCFIILLPAPCCVNITFQSHTHYLL